MLCVVQNAGLYYGQSPDHTHLLRSHNHAKKEMKTLTDQRNF